MKKGFLALALVAVAGLGACEENTTSPNNNNNNNSGANYFPLTQGSSWTYVVPDFFDTGDTTETKTIAADTVINGKTYKKITSSDSDYNEFMRRSNDTVFAFEDGVETILLIERKGATWTAHHEDEESVSNLTFTVQLDGLSRTVLGKPYTNVLQVHAAGSVTINGETPETIDGAAYFSKGIGLIEEDNGFFSSQLQSYTIK